MIIMPFPESPDDMHPVYLHLQVKLPAGKYSIRATTKGRRAVSSPTRYTKDSLGTVVSKNQRILSKLHCALELLVMICREHYINLSRMAMQHNRLSCRGKIPPSVKVLWASRFMDALYSWDVSDNDSELLSHWIGLIAEQNAKI
jgi:hypothetical protein